MICRQFSMRELIVEGHRRGPWSLLELPGVPARLGDVPVAAEVHAAGVDELVEASEGVRRAALPDLLEP